MQKGQVTLSRLRFAFTLDCGWGCWRESGYAKLKGHFHSDTVKQSKCTTYIQHVSLIYIQISSLSLIFVRGGSRRYLCILNFNSAAIAILLRQHFRRHQQLPLLLIIAVLYAEAAVFNQKLYNCVHFKTVYYGDTRAFLVHDFGAIMYAVSADGSWAE